MASDLAVEKNPCTIDLMPETTPRPSAVSRYRFGCASRWFPAHLRRNRVLDSACCALESDSVRLDWWDAERRAEAFVDAVGATHQFLDPRVVAHARHLRVEPHAMARGCLGEMLLTRRLPDGTTRRVLLYAPSASGRTEGTCILHGVAEDAAESDWTHGDVWRLHLALTVTCAELSWIARRHRLSLRALAAFQPHADLGLLALRLWCVRRLGLLQPKLRGFRG